MKVAGQATLHAPVDRVWQALNDPAVLVATIPGCQRLEATGPDAYDMTVSAGVASIKGTYAGKVALSQQQEPRSFLMSASGAGAPGTVSADVRVELSESDGATTVRYDADAVVGGVIGGVGQRMLAGVAKKMAGEFFSAVDDVLTGRTVVGVPEAAGGAGVAAGGAALPGSVAAPVTGPGQVVVHAPSDTSGRAAGVPYLVGAVIGAAIALLGVLVGARSARSARR